MVSAKAKGTQVERIAMKLLEQDGFVVTRAAGSHGPWDLVAVKYVECTGSDGAKFLTAAQVRLVQVKYDGKLLFGYQRVISSGREGGFRVTIELWKYARRRGFR